DRSRTFVGPAPRSYVAQGHHPASTAGDHSAIDQPIPEPGEKLLAGSGYRLPGNGFAVRRHRSQPDRPGHRTFRPVHVRVLPAGTALEGRPDRLAGDHRCCTAVHQDDAAQGHLRDQPMGRPDADTGHRHCGYRRCFAIGRGAGV
nr:hypothetical protein [Tanacetum cinerariifolium]